MGRFSPRCSTKVQDFKGGGFSSIELLNERSDDRGARLLNVVSSRMEERIPFKKGAFLKKKSLVGPRDRLTYGRSGIFLRMDPNGQGRWVVDDLLISFQFFWETVLLVEPFQGTRKPSKFPFIFSFRRHSRRSSGNDKRAFESLLPCVPSLLFLLLVPAFHPIPTGNRDAEVLLFGNEKRAALLP